MKAFKAKEKNRERTITAIVYVAVTCGGYKPQRPVSPGTSWAILARVLAAFAEVSGKVVGIAPVCSSLTRRWARNSGARSAAVEPLLHLLLVRLLHLPRNLAHADDARGLSSLILSRQRKKSPGPAGI